MKLNKSGREEMRQFVEEKLKDVPEGVKVKLNYNLLEQLLFENVVIEKEDEHLGDKKTTIKLVAWHGDFLSKIDLNPIYFGDVLLDTSLEKYYKGISQINYSNTNATIVMQSEKVKRVSDAIVGCNFANTAVKINTSNSSSIRIIDCDFTNSGLVLDLDCYDSYELQNVKGIDIRTKTRENILDISDNKSLTSCTLNGKPIIDRETIDERRERISQEYDDYKEHLKNVIIKNIDKQVRLVREHKN